MKVWCDDEYISLFGDVGFIVLQCLDSYIWLVGEIFVGKLFVLLVEKVFIFEGIVFSKRNNLMDILCIFIISESEYCIYNLFIVEKYVMLGYVLCMKSGMWIFDFGSGLGEMFCIWVCDYGVIGIGIDISLF